VRAAGLAGFMSCTVSGWKKKVSGIRVQRVTGFVFVVIGVYYLPRFLGL
jgi:hypothetical protein